MRQEGGPAPRGADARGAPAYPLARARFAATALIAAALCVLAACARAPEAPAPSTLRAWLNSDILSTDPGMRRDQNTDAVLMHLVEGLVALREDGSIGPLLASGWTLSRDGRTYRFALRPDVRFHNGAPLTAEDVVWSLRRYFDPRANWRCRAELVEGRVAKIEAVEAPNADTVVIRIDRPAPLFLTTLARTDCGGTGITHRDSVAADGTWRAPIGTGPFKFGEWKRNQYVELVRFDEYASLPGPRDGNTGGKPALVERVRFMVIPDSSAARAALLRGALDVADGLSPQELASVRGDRDIRLVDSPTWDLYAILLQPRDPALRSPELRRAIALSIDVEGLTRAVTWRSGLPDSSLAPVISPYFAALPSGVRAQNLDEARRLRQASGYDGRPIEIITNHRYPQMFDIAVLAHAMAAEAGINLRIVTLDWASQLERYGRGDYQAMAFSYSARPDPTMQFGTLIGDSQADSRRTWDTQDARRLLDLSMTLPPGAARQETFNALHAEFLSDAPAIALFNTRSHAALRANVSGYKPWPASLQRLWGVSLASPEDLAQR